jgi:hypothetical protein
LVLLRVLQVFDEQVGFNLLGDLLPVVSGASKGSWWPLIEHCSLQDFDGGVALASIVKSLISS